MLDGGSQNENVFVRSIHYLIPRNGRCWQLTACLRHQLPYSLKRAFRNDGSTEPLVLPAEFRAYAVLAEWTPHHWIINAYVLDDEGSVLFTVEGKRQ